MRLHQISFAMRQQMEGGQAVGAESLAGIAGFAPPTLHSLGARLGSAMSRRLFNVVITNVPGPQVPLYAGDARMLSTYPVMPLASGQALSIGLTSYDGGVYYGLNGDRDAMPDLDVLGQCLTDALTELVESRERATVTTPRRGLVLGGGGVLGAAWMVGALRGAGGRARASTCATFESLVGHLGRVGPRQPARRRRRRSRTSSPPAGARGHRPSRWPASPWTTRTATGRRPAGRGPGRHRLAPAAGAQRPAPAPPAADRGAVGASCPRAAAASTASAPSSRTSCRTAGCARPGLRVVALDYDTGARVPFGAPGVPDVELPDGGDGVLRDPRLVPTGAHRRPPVHRRRRVVVHQHRPAGRPRSGRGLRPRSPGQLRRRPPEPAEHPAGAAVAGPGHRPGRCARSTRCTGTAPR